MRRACNVDANQNDIVKALRQAGASVEPRLARLGCGVPDLLVGIRGVTTLFEIKDGSKSPSRRQLTDDEKEWHDAWRGSKYVIESVEQALTVLASL
jgi:hypothetical protein